MGNSNMTRLSTLKSGASKPDPTLVASGIDSSGGHLERSEVLNSSQYAVAKVFRGGR